jgi:hypothetical protein
MHQANRQVLSEIVDQFDYIFDKIAKVAHEEQDYMEYLKKHPHHLSDSNTSGREENLALEISYSREAIEHLESALSSLKIIDHHVQRAFCQQRSINDDSEILQDFLSAN